MIKNLLQYETSIVYAEEADVLNMALFGMTEKQWRDRNYVTRTKFCRKVREVKSYSLDIVKRITFLW